MLQLLADGLGFAGPLLLNALISYMENPSEASWHGYIYAAGLFFSTLTASLLTAHFDYLVKRVGIKFSSGESSCTELRSCPLSSLFIAVNVNDTLIIAGKGTLLEVDEELDIIYP